MLKKTKILATIGPASDTVEILENLIIAGVNVFRLNFSHGTHEYHLKTLHNIRTAMTNLNQRVGVLQDISGPKIRVSELQSNFELKSGDIIEIYKEDIEGTQESNNLYILSINNPDILELVKKDENIYFYDGKIKTVVIKKDDKKITVKVLNNGTLSSKKGVNFPNTKLNIDILTKKDVKDILWGIEHDIDFMAISFVQTADDILRVKEYIQKNNKRIAIFAKIEKFDAVENIDEIIDVSDGIMVARGDLGIEMPYYQVPIIQKNIIRKANEKSKPVITATQMLLSMVDNNSATRAEISDVANAVLDGTDAVMLSEETTVGKYPVLTVETMTKTIIEAEKNYFYNKFDKFKFLDEIDIVSSSVASLARDLGAEGILSMTRSGRSALKLSRYRLIKPIYAITYHRKIANFLTIAWGVNPIVMEKKDGLKKIISCGVSKAYEEGLIDDSKTYLVTAGYPITDGGANFIRILKKEQIEYYHRVAGEDNKK